MYQVLDLLTKRGEISPPDILSLRSVSRQLHNWSSALLAVYAQYQIPVLTLENSCEFYLLKDRVTETLECGCQYQHWPSPGDLRVYFNGYTRDQNFAELYRKIHALNRWSTPPYEPIYHSPGCSSLAVEVPVQEPELYWSTGFSPRPNKKLKFSDDI